MVIGVNRRFAALGAGQNLVRAAGDHFVGVHVRLGARTRLPHHQRELIGQRSAHNFACGSDNRFAQLGIKHAQRHVGFGRRQLLQAKRADQRRWHAFAANREVDDAALRLRAPVHIGWHRHFAQRIGFDPHILPIRRHVTHRSHPCLSRIESRRFARFPKHSAQARSKPLEHHRGKSKARESFMGLGQT